MDQGALLRAELYLCLSQAFMPPMSEEARLAMTTMLADDLGDISRALGLDLEEALAGYRAAVAALPSGDALLQRYSRLFLAPPVPVRINAGMYLDGAINGNSCDALVDCYRSWGIDTREDFHDLPDHVSSQLEFAAHAFANGAQAPEGASPRTAGEFLGRFVAPWLGRFNAALEEATQAKDGVPDPYAQLGRVLALAVEHDAVLPAPEARSKRELGILEARRQWSNRELSEKDMRVIAERLRSRGLASDHLSVPVANRDAERGWTHRRPR